MRLLLAINSYSHFLMKYLYCAWSGETEDEGSDVRVDEFMAGAIGTWTLTQIVSEDCFTTVRKSSQDKERRGV